jgi:hypothetical protein
MWKLIKGSYSATREVVRFIGEGKDLVVSGLEEFKKGMETLNVELESKNIELRETNTFKLYIHKLKITLLIIKNKQKLTPTRYENLHRFYDLQKKPIGGVIDLLQIAIDNPIHRHFVQNIVDEIMAKIDSNEDEECKIELEEIYSKGLDKNASLLEAIHFYFKVTSNDELERKVKPMLPNLIKNYNILTKKFGDVIRYITELDR